MLIPKVKPFQIDKNYVKSSTKMRGKEEETGQWRSRSGIQMWQWVLTSFHFFATCCDEWRYVCCAPAILEIFISFEQSLTCFFLSNGIPFLLILLWIIVYTFPILNEIYIYINYTINGQYDLNIIWINKISIMIFHTHPSEVGNPYVLTGLPFIPNIIYEWFSILKLYKNKLMNIINEIKMIFHNEMI